MRVLIFVVLIIIAACVIKIGSDIMFNSGYDKAITDITNAHRNFLSQKNSKVNENIGVIIPGLYSSNTKAGKDVIDYIDKYNVKIEIINDKGNVYVLKMNNVVKLKQIL